MKVYDPELNGLIRKNFLVQLLSWCSKLKYKVKRISCMFHPPKKTNTVRILKGLSMTLVHFFREHEVLAKAVTESKQQNFVNDKV